MNNTITVLPEKKARDYASSGPSVGEIEALAVGITNAFIRRCFRVFQVSGELTETSGIDNEG